MPKIPTVIALVGPTAIGKTAAAIRMAQALKTDVVSADSRQFYREMSIGTAKPTREEQAEATHHFVDFLSIHQEYSAGHYERDVIDFLDGWLANNPSIVLAGGSGLYLNAVVNGFDELPANPVIREALNKQLHEEGLPALQAQLAQCDPEHYHRMDIHNPQRVIRALEVCLTTGTPYSQLRTQSATERNFRTVWVGLTAPRELMYQRINQRVERMVENGLIDEARGLYPHRSLNALNTVGYKELFAHFDGDLSEAEAIALIQQNTRNFAKRQVTWFKRQSSIVWFDFREVDSLIAYAVEQSVND